MVRFCAFPNCPNKMAKWTTRTFHRLPFAYLEILKLWLVALKMDPDTDMEALKRADHRVCSAHFNEQDFLPRPEKPKHRKTERQRRRLRVAAIPVAEDTTDPLELEQIYVIEPEAPAQSDEDSDVPEEFKLKQVHVSEPEAPAQSDEDSDVPEEFKATFNRKKKKAESDEDWSPQMASDTENEDRKSSSDEDEDITFPKVNHLCAECGCFHSRDCPHTCAHIKKPCVCNICARRYATEESLKRHMKSHTDNFEHRCVYCYATIITQQDKLLHQQIHHTQSQPYQCRYCASSFSSFSERNKHNKSHKGPLQYKCDVCGNHFYGNNQLERHMLVHTGVKPFKCSVCERSFKQEGHLKSHMRLHTGERPYACPHCDKAFNHNVSLKSHIQRYHPSECGDREDSSCDGAEKKSDTQELRETGPTHTDDEQKQDTLEIMLETVVKPTFRRHISGRPRGRPKRPAVRKRRPNVQNI